MSVVANFSFCAECQNEVSELLFLILHIYKNTLAATCENHIGLVKL